MWQCEPQDGREAAGGARPRRAVKKYKDIVGDGGSDVVGQVREQHERMRRRLAAVRHVVAVVSGKGGVGKSTLTGGLACALGLAGWHVGVLDADLNGPTMAKILGVRGRRLTVVGDAVEPPRSALGIKVMSMDLLLASDAAPLAWQAPTQDEAHTWRGSMEAQALREFLADTAWGSLDALIVDLPPGTDRLATVTSLVPTTAIVVVTIPSDLSQLVVRKSITVARSTGAPVLGLVENMAGLLSGPDASVLADEAGIPFLGRVPFDRALALAADRGDPLVATPADGEAARALAAIAARVRAALSLQA
jgi:ATP-binding protein involved in chromosome partitioning